MKAAGPKERWFGGVAFLSGKKLRAVSQKTTNGLDFKAARVVCEYAVSKHFEFSHGELTRKLKRSFRGGTATESSSEGLCVHPNRARAKTWALIKKQMHGVSVEHLWACTSEETFPYQIWTM